MLTGTLIIDVADAIVAALNGLQFAEPFVATRAWNPAYKPSELTTLRVTVVPLAMKDTEIARDSEQQEFEIHVGVQKKLDSTDETTQIDALVGLVQAIRTVLMTWRMEGDPFAVVISAPINPIADRDHLDDLRVFTSVIQLKLVARVATV